MGERLAWLVARVTEATIPPGDENFGPIDWAPWAVVQGVAKLDLELAALAAAAEPFDSLGWHFEDAVDHTDVVPAVDAALRQQAAVLQLVRHPPDDVDLSQRTWVDSFRDARDPRR